jgi:protein SMG8
MMRVHVVTPKAPVHITIFPSVVPCPDGPMFHSGWSQPVKLPINSYWILRLPFIYQGK